MGLPSIFKLVSKGSIQNGDTTLNTNSILGVDAQAITPTNPGELGIFRSVPVAHKPGYLTQAQANQLALKAKELEIKANAACEGYEHLKSIKNSDVKVHKAYNSYRGHEARKTFSQVRSNADYAKQVNGLRGQYAALNESVSHKLELEKVKQQAIGTKTAEYSNLW